jgi:hypothetical protein
MRHYGLTVLSVKRSSSQPGQKVPSLPASESLMFEVLQLQRGSMET